MRQQMPQAEEFMRTGAPGVFVESMTAEQRGRHNFERMMRAVFATPLHKQRG